MAAKRPEPPALDNCDGLYAIVAARFNTDVVDRLIEGATRRLAEQGIAGDKLTLLRVPGAFELPQAVKRLVLRDRFDAIIALGAVIRGDTPHFDYVCRAVTDGLLQVSLESDCPVIFGVLTTGDHKQAMARAGGSAGNKGEDAAVAAMEMVARYRDLNAADSSSW